MRLYKVCSSGFVLLLAFFWVGRVQAVPATFDWGSFDAQGGTGFGVYEGNDVTILPTGALAQLIWAGPDGMIDPPQANGLPGGDDQLLDSGRVINGQPLPPPQFNKGYIPLKTFSFDSDDPRRGGWVAIRAWNAVSAGSATAYGDSEWGTLEIGSTLNASRWHMITAPTAVTLSRIELRSGSSLHLAAVLMAILSSLSVTVVVVLRRDNTRRGAAANGCEP